MTLRQLFDFLIHPGSRQPKRPRRPQQPDRVLPPPNPFTLLAGFRD